MNTLIKQSALTVALLGAFACGTEEATPEQGEVRSELTRQTPNVPAADAEELVEGNTAFALDLYRESVSEPGNVMSSPYSVSIALAMLYAGAKGNTEAEMASALR